MSPKIVPNRPDSNLLQDCVQMLTQHLLNQRLTADRVVIKDHAITPNIEGQFLAMLSKENRWLVERAGITDLIQQLCEEERLLDFLDAAPVEFQLGIHR